MADPKHPRHHDEAFERQIVQSYESGRPSRETKAEYDIARSALRRWIQGIRDSGSTPPSDTGVRRNSPNKDSSSKETVQRTVANPMRQYTSNGRIPGYADPLDLNYFRGTTAQWNKYVNPGNTTVTPTPAPQPSRPSTGDGYSVVVRSGHHQRRRRPPAHHQRRRRPPHRTMARDRMERALRRHQPHLARPDRHLPRRRHGYADPRRRER